MFFAKKYLISHKKAARYLAAFGIGGGKRDRTADLLNAIQTLSQLSYTPSDKATIKNQNPLVK